MPNTKVVIARKKKTYRRKKRYRRRKARIPLGIYPKQKVCRLRYCEEIFMDAGVGGLSIYSFAANGLYDPNQSSTGHQPKGFDEAMLAYNHYQVLGSKITVKHLSSLSATLIPGVFGVHLSDTASRISGYSLEQIYESRMINPRQIKQIMGRTHGGEQVQAFFSQKKMFGRSSKGSDRMRGDATSNPSEGALYDIFVSSVDGNNPDRLTFMVTIDYVCKFTEPKPLVQS